MSDKEDGGPAFPFTKKGMNTNGAPLIREWDGMSLRDYFAGQVLAGMSAQYDPRSTSEKDQKALDQWRADLIRIYAEFCYQMADAMIEVRKK